MQSPWYKLTLLFYFGLLALMLLWPTWIAPPKEISISLILAIATLPLLLVLFGVLHERPYALAWTAFISLLYFIHGTMDAWTERGIVQWLALSEALLSFALFICSTYAARHAALKLKDEASKHE